MAAVVMLPYESNYTLATPFGFLSMITPSSLNSRTLRSMSAVVLAAAGLMAGSAANALTLVLDFTSTTVTDDSGHQVWAEDYLNTFGFNSMNLNQVLSGVTAAVRNDYLGYPTSATDPLSPLAPGKELNLNVEFTTNHSAPSNGDSEYYFMGIGSDPGQVDYTGMACFGCVRRINSSGVAVGPSYGTQSGDTIGTVWTNVIGGAYAGVQADPSYGPLTDAQRVLFLAGTISHEFGHSLYLDHPGGPIANPGASPFSLMATGADPIPMYDPERRLDRSFAYSEYATLVQTVGVRDVSPVPEPSTYVLMSMGLFGVMGARRRKSRQVSAEV